MPVQPSDIQGLAWAEEGSLVVRLDADRASDGGLSSVDLESGAIAPIEVPTPDTCRKRDLSAPVAVGPSELAAAETCYPPNGPETATIIVANIQTGDVARLGRVDRIVRFISLYPDRQTAILSLGSRICQGIAELADGRVVPIEMDVVTPDGAFNLADEMRIGANPCDATGRADGPALSPHGDVLAFFASAGSVGRGGTDRLAATWDLMLKRDAEDPRVVLGGIDEPFEAGWDPTGRWLAFGADIEGSPGTWIFDLTNDRVQRLTDTTAQGLSWSPDGRSVAVVEATGDVGPDGVPLRTISILDISALLTN